MFSQVWFVAVFTAIPILMVAGALERRTLISSSRHEKTARLHKWLLRVGIAGIIAALAGISFTEQTRGDEAPRLAIYLVAAVSIAGMGAMLGLVWHSAWLVLDGEPHQDRLKSELRDLRQREAELVSRISKPEERDADDD